MIVIDGQTLSVSALHSVASGEDVVLADSARKLMDHNAVLAKTPDGASNVLEQKRDWLLGEHAREIPSDELARAFVVGHCAGVGAPLPVEVVRGAIAARANVLAAGASGCRPIAAEVLLQMLNQRVHPTVPSQGSVGAAGDLAPMAHIARVAAGWDDSLRAPGLTPFSPTAKEALALINGVSLTASLAAIAVFRARRVLDTATAVCAMTMEAVGADANCLDPRALAARGHPTVSEVGRRLRHLLEGSHQVHQRRKPDAFSIRCAPHVLAAATEALDHTETIVTRELNGVSDNPLVFEVGQGVAEQGAAEWIEAGNFHGASLALAMDHLKVALTQVATLSERHTFRLTYGQLTPGLPSFLVAGTGLNSGFMIGQYTAASLASECKGLAHPASVDSVPTVQHHEDHVSMGPIAARGAIRIIECVADIVGIEALLAAQALDLRKRGLAFDEAGDPLPAKPIDLAPEIESLHAVVRSRIQFWEDDEVLHPAIAAAGSLIRRGALAGPERSVGPW